MKRLEICRPGTFVDVNGNMTPITEQDLRECATIYNPKQRSSPLVIGHPKLDDPAYGWVAALDYVDGALVAVPERVNDKFAKAVEEGSYPNRSAAFFPPTHPNNPIPGKWYLKHVGFLGAAQPAVDGLKPVEFGAFEDPGTGGGLVVSFAAWEAAIRHRERGRIDKEHQLATLTTELVKSGRLRPTEREEFVALASTMLGGGIIAFGSGDDRVETDTFTAFAKFMRDRAPLVQLGRYDMGKGPAPTVEFAMPDGVPVDSERADVHARAEAYRRQTNCDYVTAVRAVTAETARR